MLLPYGTDAPIYHWPYATVGLIVVNLALFFFWPPYDEFSGLSYDTPEVERYDYELEPDPELDAGDPEVPADREEIDLPVEEEAPPTAGPPTEEDLVVMLSPPQVSAEQFLDDAYHPDWRILEFHNGLRPWQWVTANFMHADFMHVLSNMLFLWPMGLVIEGKLGWWRFLLVYVGIGTIGYGVVQLLMLAAEPGGALGASLPIFGLIVLALIWAPLNDFNCVLYAGVSSRLIDLPIYMFALFYLVLQVAIFVIGGMNMGSEGLHLMGALVALPIGLVMLQRRLVDCEHYDVISVWRGHHELSRDEHRQLEEATPEFQAKVSNQKETMLAQVTALVEEQKNPALAWATHERMSHRFQDWALPRELHYKLIKLFLQQGQNEAALPAMFAYLRNFAFEQTFDMRLKLAEVLIRGERPRQGLQLLAGLQPEMLGEKQRQALTVLRKMGDRRREEVDFEPAVEEV